MICTYGIRESRLVERINIESCLGKFKRKGVVAILERIFHPIEYRSLQTHLHLLLEFIEHWLVRASEEFATAYDVEKTAAVLPERLLVGQQSHALEIIAIEILSGGDEAEQTGIIAQLHTVKFGEHLAQMIDGHTAGILHLVLLLVGPQ